MMLILLIGTLLLLLYALAVQGRMHELAETTYRASAQRNATLVEGLVGFETVKALGAEARLQYKVGKERGPAGASVPSCACCRPSAPVTARPSCSRWSTSRS